LDIEPTRIVQELWHVSPYLCTVLQDSASVLRHPWGLLNPKTELSKQLVSNQAESKAQQSARAVLLPSNGAEKGHWSHEKNKMRYKIKMRKKKKIHF